MPIPTPSGEDVAIHYQQAHERLMTLVADLDEDLAATAVPSTPGWSVHDVVAHLAAISTQALAGGLHGIPAADDTERQVAQRRARPFPEVVEEWSANVPAMAEAARAGAVRAHLAVDAVTHEQDVRGALRLPRIPDAEALRFSNSLYAAGTCRRIALAGLAPLGIETIDTGDRYGVPDHEATATVKAVAFEVFRALSGRRSRRQVAEYAWSGADITPYLDVLNVFGDLPGDDIEE